MIGLDGIITVMADVFFGGDTSIASMAVFVGVMMVVFAMFGRDSLMIPFALMLPITVIFNAMAVLPDALTILMIVVAIVGLVATIRDKVI